MVMTAPPDECSFRVRRLTVFIFTILTNGDGCACLDGRNSVVLLREWAYISGTEKREVRRRRMHA
jgi:hypothetical protein